MLRELKDKLISIAFLCHLSITCVKRGANVSNWLHFPNDSKNNLLVSTLILAEFKLINALGWFCKVLHVGLGKSVWRYTGFNWDLTEGAL
jgi:hypothetical protein